jgi:GT2 family glycosyltransferase
VWVFICTELLSVETNSIGVVIIGRNEGERLRACIDSTKAEVENIVYVDSGSVDDSIEMAKLAGLRVVPLSSDQPYTAARARNEGFCALKSSAEKLQYVQFIDGDCILVPGWLERARGAMAEDDVAIACGRRRERFPENSIYNRLIDIEWNTPIGEATACGGDFLVRATAFESVDGFASGLIAGEEPELCLRLLKKGWRIRRLDADMTVHDAAITRFTQWWRRAERGGYASVQLWFRHRSSPPAAQRTQTIRAIVWGGVIPTFIFVGGFVSLKALVFLVIYPMQVARLAVKRGIASADAWAYGLLLTIGKVAEVRGILRYCWVSLRGAIPTLIEYK